MQDRQRDGKTLVFPTVNTPHVSLPGSNKKDLSAVDLSFLQKRCLELSRDKEELITKVERLSEDNMRLVASTRNWFEKYQEAILKREESPRFTPVKDRRHKYNEGLLDFE